MDLTGNPPTGLDFAAHRSRAHAPAAVASIVAARAGADLIATPNMPRSPGDSFMARDGPFHAALKRSALSGDGERVYPKKGPGPSSTP